MPLTKNQAASFSPIYGLLRVFAECAGSASEEMCIGVLVMPRASEDPGDDLLQLQERFGVERSHVLVFYV
jgi:hypothetical protein